MKTKRTALIVIAILSIISVVIYVSPIGNFTAVINKEIENPSFEQIDGSSWTVLGIANADVNHVKYDLSSISWKSDGLRSLRVFGNADRDGALLFSQVFTVPKNAARINADLNIIIKPHSGSGYRLELCPHDENIDISYGTDGICIDSPSSKNTNPLDTIGITTLTLDIPESYNGKLVRVTLRNVYEQNEFVDAYWDNVRLE